jgi:hypothetical protein
MFHGLAGIAQPVKQQAMACTVEESGFNSRKGKYFSVLHSVQTRSDALSVSCPMTSGGSFPGGKTLPLVSTYSKKKKGKAIPVTGREGPQGWETSRVPHYLDNRLTYGGKVVSLTHQPLPPKKIPGTHFC